MKKYPLQQLAFIKKKKLQESERILREKKEALTAEEEKLKSLEKERDKAKAHKNEKLTQLREALDEGSPTHEIEQMRTYLKIIEETYRAHENRVTEQKAEVVKAQEAVKQAREEMLQRQRDVEKLKEHKGEWTKEMHKELAKEEGKEEDEMGITRFIRHKRGR